MVVCTLNHDLDIRYDCNKLTWLATGLLAKPILIIFLLSNNKVVSFTLPSSISESPIKTKVHVGKNFIFDG